MDYDLDMETTTESTTDTDRYARCIEVSRRIRWDIDDDVIRGREFDFSEKFLPDTISRIDQLDFLKNHEKIVLSQIQGRTYANMFGLVERFICAKIIEVSCDHLLGDQVALESLVRFSDEELKHQELFRRIGAMIENGMPAGYMFALDPNEFARSVLDNSSWAVLALICHIELFTQSHYKESIAPDDNVSALYKDVFLYHWREESQHAVMDELEWKREDRKITNNERDQAVDELINLILTLDGILQAQVDADVAYLMASCSRGFSEVETGQLQKTVLAAYRWQYIVSGIENPRFEGILSGMINRSQAEHIQSALGPILH